jgi:hypothetical protein
MCRIKKPGDGMLLPCYKEKIQGVGWILDGHVVIVVNIEHQGLVGRLKFIPVIAV